MEKQIAELVIWLIFIWGFLRLVGQRGKKRNTPQPKPHDQKQTTSQEEESE